MRQHQRRRRVGRILWHRHHIAAAVHAKIGHIAFEPIRHFAAIDIARQKIFPCGDHGEFPRIEPRQAIGIGCCQDVIILIGDEPIENGLQI